MLTQIEIDGFKTFKDFKVELAPFQVIVGPNGSGKSNLFDALHLLSRLADSDLRSAFQAPYDDPQKLRGDAHELFTLLSNGQRSNRIKIAVEMLVDSQIQDSGGGEIKVSETGSALLKQKITLKYTRMRYELEITFHTDDNDQPELSIVNEALKSIPLAQDNWYKKYRDFSQPTQSSEFADNQMIFIDTQYSLVAILESVEDKSVAEAHLPMIHLYSDEDKTGRIKRFFASEVRQTILNRTNDLDYPHVFAARQEMLSWKFLHLSHEILRLPSSVNSPDFLTSVGGNLPTMLARMQREDEFALSDVSRDLANLVPDVVGIELRKDDFLNRYTVWVKYQDGRSFPSSVLSDGTLRLLALAALKNDEKFHGVLCFEEPENGIHPSYLREIAHLLRGMATDFRDPQQIDEPLRQVLVTTHSPTFISQPDAIDVVLFTYTATRVEPEAAGIPPLRVTEAAPVIIADTYDSQSGIDRGKEGYTIDRVKELLVNESLDDALELLDKSHNTLNEGSR